MTLLVGDRRVGPSLPPYCSCRDLSRRPRGLLSITSHLCSYVGALVERLLYVHVDGGRDGNQSSSVPHGLHENKPGTTHLFLWKRVHRYSDSVTASHRGSRRHQWETEDRSPSTDTDVRHFHDNQQTRVWTDTPDETSPVPVPRPPGSSLDLGPSRPTRSGSSGGENRTHNSRLRLKKESSLPLSHRTELNVKLPQKSKTHNLKMTLEISLISGPPKSPPNTSRLKKKLENSSLESPRFFFTFLLLNLEYSTEYLLTESSTHLKKTLFRDTFKRTGGSCFSW